MRTIYLHHPMDKQLISNEDVVLVLGFFDGVHRGHQAVIHRGLEEARKRHLPLALLTFNQKPDIVFKKCPHLTYLSSWEQKQQLMEMQGVDLLYRMDFTSAFSKLSPQAFIKQYICGLHAKAVVAGYDYTYGPKKVANMSQLPLYAEGRFDVITVDKQEAMAHKISSTRIRQTLHAGDIETTNALLGYHYKTTGKVVHGDARGRTLGFPTANLSVSAHLCLPKEGVYIVRVYLNGEVYHGMTSIGRNITFETNRPVTIETNILDFDEEIYGETLTIEWCHHLRDEIKFQSVDDLIAQLHRDEQAVRAYFKKED